MHILGKVAISIALGLVIFGLGFFIGTELGYQDGYREGYQFGELDGRQSVFESIRDADPLCYDPVQDVITIKYWDVKSELEYCLMMPWPRTKVGYVKWEEKIGN